MPAASGRLGLPDYQANPSIFTSAVFINTPIVADVSGATRADLVGLDPATLQQKNVSPGVPVRVALKDPRGGGSENARVSDDSSVQICMGTSDYLIFGQDNDYACLDGGNGVNRIAVFVNLSGARRATVAGAQGRCTITNDGKH